MSTTVGGSWGGTVNHGDDGMWHMHVAQFVGLCGFNQWATNSRIVHAVADAPDGRYEVADEAVPVWSHNPAVTRAPTGEWVMTWVQNRTVDAAAVAAQCDADGNVIRNSSVTVLPLQQHNFMAVAKNPGGPWSSPIPLDSVFDGAVAPFLVQKKYPNRNTNLVMSIQADGSMVGLWRRCCSPPPALQPPGGGGASVVFSVRAPDWRNVSSWRASSVPILPALHANGYEDPHVWRDAKRKGVFHAIFHGMIGGWHKPEFNNTQVGTHAYSADGGRTWVDTGVAFNLTVEYSDGRGPVNFIQRERPHLVLNSHGEPTHLISGVTWSLTPTLQTSTIVQPLGAD